MEKTMNVNTKTERNAEIKRRRLAGETAKELGEAFGISPQRIHQIANVNGIKGATIRRNKRMEYILVHPEKTHKELADYLGVTIGTIWNMRIGTEYLGKLPRSKESAMLFYSERGNSQECWKWNGNFHAPTGLGRMNAEGKVFYAHRVAWELENGEIPEGVYINPCNINRTCVNPAHLEIYHKARKKNRR